MHRPAQSLGHVTAILLPVLAAVLMLFVSCRSGEASSSDATPLSIEQAEQQGRAAARAVAAADHADTLLLQRVIIDAHAQRSTMFLAGNDEAAKAFDNAFLDELQQCDPQLAAEIKR